MTAPTPIQVTPEEKRAARFERAKPKYTGHHLTPEQLRQRLEPWWFADMECVAQVEEERNMMFCHECAVPSAPVSGLKVGQQVWPLLVDYMFDPLRNFPALSKLLCVNCGFSEMIPIHKLNYDTGHVKVDQWQRDKEYQDARMANLAQQSSMSQQMAALQGQKSQYHQQMAGIGQGVYPGSFGGAGVSAPPLLVPNQIGGAGISSGFMAPIPTGPDKVQGETTSDIISRLRGILKR